ncbi:MAG: hypothetical protein EXX96DRAFT_11345 [Benjaminiella poitrasii]|nr:MAG: hypothetical protein EXX96DRAFT_11345 [Benjaminiella poitrasii]
MIVISKSISRIHRSSVSCYQNRLLFTSFRKAFFKKVNKLPIPETVSDTQMHHGKPREDLFSWMENLSNQHLGSYIRSENQYTHQAMHRHRFLHKIVLNEMKKRLHVPTLLEPLKTVACGYEYYSTTSPYGLVYLRKKLGEKDTSEVIIQKKKKKKLKNAK